MYRQRTRPFDGPRLFDLVEDRKAKVLAKIASAQAVDLAGASDQEVAATLAEPFLLSSDLVADYEHPEFDDEEVEIQYEQFGRHVRQRVQQFQVFVRLTGDLEMLGIRPMSGPLSYPQSATIAGNNLVFTYKDVTGSGAAGIRRQFDNDLNVVRQGIENLRSSIEQYNQTLRTIGVTGVSQRRLQLEQQATAASEMGMPRREKA